MVGTGFLEAFGVMPLKKARHARGVSGGSYPPAAAIKCYSLMDFLSRLASTPFARADIATRKE